MKVALTGNSSKKQNLYKINEEPEGFTIYGKNRNEVKVKLNMANLEIEDS